MNVEVTSDGRTVWVNNDEQCVARFGPKGWEIGEHVEVFDDAAPSGTIDDWHEWTREVERVLSVQVGDEHMPAAVDRRDVPLASRPRADGGVEREEIETVSVPYQDRWPKRIIVPPEMEARLRNPPRNERLELIQRLGVVNKHLMAIDLPRLAQGGGSATDDDETRKLREERAAIMTRMKELEDAEGGDAG